MKPLLTLLFIAITHVLHAQIIEEFSDGNLTQNPTWLGDLAQFTINTNYHLQLNSNGSDSSHLSFASPLNSADSLQWEIGVQQSFSPSSQNYGRVYLTSDNANLELPLNGYYVQFGETGSNDAICIFRQTGNVSTLICRGTDATISNSFTVRIKVTKTPAGIWKLYTDYTGGTNFNEEATGSDNTNSIFNYFGIKAVYTSSNATKFYYDEIYTGEFIADTLPPQITGLTVFDSTTIQLQFSEKIRNTDANNSAHFYINGNMVLQSVQDAGMSSVTLTTSQTFVSPNNYQITTYQIHDLEGNLTALDSINFHYLTTAPIAMHDLIINEIMSDPSGVNNLPNAEYIEIYNRSLKYINSSGYIITDGSTDAILPNDTIAPGEYRVYFNNSHAGEFAQQQISNTRGLATFPGLNNDGDHITLRDQNGNTIDKISYTLNSYHDEIKQLGGWSIERKDPEFTCSNEDNWQASINTRGGTPGEENSEIIQFIDNKAPDIEYITVTDSLNIEIHFNEVPDFTEVTDTLNYLISTNIGLSQIHIKDDNELSYKLQLRNPLQREVIYSINAKNISDCAGNKMQNESDIRFGIGEEMNKRDLLLNEILFNPGTGQFDYIELYNNSNKIISLYNAKLAQNDIITEEIKSTTLITEEKRVICPGEYLVICESTSFLNNYYGFSQRRGIQTNLPSMNDDEGCISMISPGMAEIDKFHYNEKMHYPLLVDAEGVALERIRNNGTTNASDNWHSASSQSGYGTPGSINSQAITATETEDQGLTIEPAIISPDNDGHNDIATITLTGNTGTGTIRIMNESGKEIKMVAEGEYLGMRNEYTWDGSTQSGAIAPVGIYIIVSETTLEKGKIIRTKKPIVVAQKREKLN